ncbi:MAG TPA: MBL fold metallo-hydrolase [Acidobacteriaceae bacterium]
MIHEVFPVGLLECNCSVLGDERSGEAIVVDPGDDIPRILAILQRHHLRVTQILITHAHIDHIAGAARLKALTGAPILYNPRDLDLVKIMDLQASWLGLAQAPDVPPPDDTLEDGHIITIGGGVIASAREADAQHGVIPAAGVAAGFSPRKPASQEIRASAPERSLEKSGITAHVLHTPGHTQGSVCLYLPGHSLLLAGDTLFAGSVGRTDLPGGDTATLLRSIHHKLLALPDATVVIPGHGPSTTIGDERATNPFLT